MSAKISQLSSTSAQSTDSLAIARSGANYKFSVLESNTYAITADSNLLKPIYLSVSVPDGTAMTDYRPFLFQTTHLPTDIDPRPNLYRGLNVLTEYGGASVGAMGTLHGITSEIYVKGSGDQENEMTPLMTCLRADIGTGYSWATTPGGYWLADMNLHGPIGVQPYSLHGIVSFVNNHYNGSPESSSSANLWVVTQKGGGGFSDSIHQAATTYPVDYGIGVNGTSGASNTERGFTTALRIGGLGNPWGASSRFGKGIEVSDWDDAGLYISGKHASAATTAAAIAVADGAGAVVIGGTASAAANIIFQIIGPDDTADPLVRIGRSANNVAQAVEVANASGTSKWFISGGNDNFITGVVAGDSGFALPTAGNAIVFGAQSASPALTIRNDTGASELGFFGVTTAAKQTVSGSRLGNAALASLLTGLANYGAITDSSTEGAAWTPYTPSWTSTGTQPTLGNGTIQGRYFQIGDSVFAKIKLTLGSTSTVGTGEYRWSVPVAADTTLAFGPQGSGRLWDSSPGTHYTFFCYQDGNTVGAVIGGGGILSATAPVTPASGDEYHITLMYEAS